MSAARLARTPTPLPVPALPADVRLTQVVASALYVLVGVAALAALVLWLSRAPMFQLRGIRIAGELQRVDAQTLRANAAPRLAGNFFSVDLQAVRTAFEAVPWVRRAHVRRVWPDHLLVTIEEHRAVALWQGAAPAERDERDEREQRDDRLVNQQGEVFAANVGDVEDEALPAFGGPEGSAATLLSLYRRLQPLLHTLDMQVEQLQLSTRGSWRVLLDGGARLELGRGSEDEVLARTQRFVRTLTQVTQRLHAPLLYADLRHVDGYAVRLRGISTTPTPSVGARPVP